MDQQLVRLANQVSAFCYCKNDHCTGQMILKDAVKTVNDGDTIANNRKGQLDMPDIRELQEDCREGSRYIPDNFKATLFYPLSSSKSNLKTPSSHCCKLFMETIQHKQLSIPICFSLAALGLDRSDTAEPFTTLYLKVQRVNITQTHPFHIYPGPSNIDLGSRDLVLLCYLCPQNMGDDEWQRPLLILTQADISLMPWVSENIQPLIWTFILGYHGQLTVYSLPA
ncbi:hypothetical protein L345_10414, partial [Ophiophagus hannah]